MPKVCKIEPNLVTLILTDLIVGEYSGHDDNDGQRHADVGVLFGPALPRRPLDGEHDEAEDGSTPQKRRESPE